MTSYLRPHRLKSGLTQRELAELIGIIAHHQVSIHERSVVVPSLLVAFSYHIVFSVPIDELFPGLYETVKQNVEERLAEFENALGESDARGREAKAVARKLEWLWERKNH
jgi:DNA-binding XRE family transcriptional regulator